MRGFEEDCLFDSCHKCQAMQYLFLFFLSVITATNDKEPCDFPTINDLKSALMGKKVGTINQAQFKCLTIKRRTVVDDYNEQVTWVALDFFYEGKALFMAESNWVDKQTISRITIFDKRIVTTSGLGVGQKMSTLRTGVAKKIPSGPDGELSVRDLKDPDIYYHLNLEGHKKLFYGASSLSEIPDQVVVKMIVIMEKE